MDAEINFPNPVVRTDLAVKKRRWPKVVIALLVLAVLTTIFLPQILSSRVGRRIVVAYLVRQSGSKDVLLESFSTSWFKGTTIKKLWIKDPMQRRIGFESLTCQASLFDLLRGNYTLGDATFEGLAIDYVVDDGRGGNGRRLLGFGAATAPGGLPRISGNIKINGGRIALWRGTVQQRLYDVKWQAAEFKNLKGQLDIQSLDQPWTYVLSADLVDDDEKIGPVTSAGTVDLGHVGRLDAREMMLDLTVDGSNVRTSSIGPVLLVGLSSEEVVQTFGASLDKLAIKVKAGGGKVNFERFDLESAVAHIHARPSLDMTGPVTALNLGSMNPGLSLEPATLRLGVTRQTGTGALVYLSPFFRDAAGGGTVAITLEYLRVPLEAKSWRAQMMAKGSFVAQNVALARLDEITGNEVFPKSLASQISLLTGSESKVGEVWTEGSFTVYDGKAASTTATSVDGVSMAVEGTTDLETGGLQHTATITIPPSAGPALAGSVFAVPLTGDMRTAQLSLLAPRGNLKDATIKALGERVNEQVSRMREKETLRLMNKAQAEVQAVVRPFQGMEKAQEGK